MSYLFLVSFRYIIFKLKAKSSAHVFVLSDFVLEKLFGKKQPVSETDVSDIEYSEIELPDEKEQDVKKQEARDKNRKRKSKFSSKKLQLWSQHYENFLCFTKFSFHRK